MTYAMEKITSSRISQQHGKYSKIQYFICTFSFPRTLKLYFFTCDNLKLYTYLGVTVMFALMCLLHT